MGHDQYLVAQKESENNTETGDFFGNPASNVVVEQLGVWRKHANLQGFMQNLAVEKKIVENVDDFNCVDLPLDLDDISRVVAAIALQDLPQTTGFFFGASYGDDAETQRDLLIFDEAASYARLGWQIIYRCWW